MKLADLEKFAGELLAIEKEIAVKKADIALREAKGEVIPVDEKAILEKASKLLPDIAEAYTMSYVNCGTMAYIDSSKIR
jgi:hypothetical protein